MNIPVRVARVALGLSQRALAARCGLTQADISRIELGWVPPRDSQQALAKALRANLTTLFPTRRPS